MSTISLTDAKTFLDVIHSADDLKLQMILDGAEDEAVQFMNRSSLTEWDSDIEIQSDYLMPASVMYAVLLLMQGMYQATPDELDKLRKAAEIKLMPYRLNIGV